MNFTFYPVFLKLRTPVLLFITINVLLFIIPPFINTDIIIIMIVIVLYYYQGPEGLEEEERDFAYLDDMLNMGDEGGKEEDCFLLLLLLLLLLYYIVIIIILLLLLLLLLLILLLVSSSTSSSSFINCEREESNHQIPQAKNIPYQPLLIKPVFNLLANAEKQVFFKTSLPVLLLEGPSFRLYSLVHSDVVIKSRDLLPDRPVADPCKIEDPPPRPCFCVSLCALI